MNRRPYTEAEDEFLRRNYPHSSIHELVRDMRRKIPSISHRAFLLGLRKDPAYLRKLQVAEGKRLLIFGNGHRFKKGDTPANKGLRRPGYSIGRGRMRETQFKKGQLPGNCLPVGTVRANSDGYLRVKVADAPNAGIGATSKNWDFVHKRVWGAAHGPIPKGYRIWWKDGDRSNCALENLELLSGPEHMARTTLHKMPAEIVAVIRMRGGLVRRIRRIERGEKQARRSA